jgi:hypothetical protein
MEPSRHGIVIEGDARGSELSYGRLLHTADPAHPITCCALAGYLGFSALAHAVGIPGFHEECREPLLRLPFSPSVSEVPPFSVLGTGQLGQAFLALTYFLSGRTPVSVHLLDRELFEDFNQRTQILLSERIDRWSGKPKSEYLADICRTWGWNVFPERKE